MHVQIRYILRNHEHSTPPAGMHDINSDALADTVQRVTDAFNELKVPLATEQQVHENLDILGLPVAMHDALAESGASAHGMHDAGVEGLMHVSHASVSLPQGSTYKAVSRLVCATLHIWTSSCFEGSCHHFPNAFPSPPEFHNFQAEF
jgi:hypothetical protein